MTSELIPPTEESFADLARRIDGLARAEAARGAPPPSEERLWAALAPGWTVELAQRVKFGDLPPDRVPVLFHELVDSGEMDRYPIDSATAEDSGGYFIMTTKARSEVLQALLPPLQTGDASPNVATRTRAPQAVILRAREVVGFLQPEQQRSVDRLLKLTATIGRRIQRSASGLELPTELTRWADLAAEADRVDKDRRRPGAARIFKSKVYPLADKGDLAGVRDWIEVARPLSILFEYALAYELSVAIGQAGRRVELEKRRAIDFRHLAAFHRRPEQVDAVRALLDGPDDQWALHLIGPGGVGKTMMVRYVSCLMEQAPNSPCAGDPQLFAREAAVARIDFDYLNLDYPQINPGLLLVQLAAELRAAGTTDTGPLFDGAEDDFKLVKDAQKAEGFRRTQRATMDPRMRDGIIKYIDALRSIEKPVVLILDTCEELAKVDEGRGENTTLEETFRILRALHDGPDALEDKPGQPGAGVETLRVIFSGRRLLASDGTDWEVKDSKLPSRPYLRLHELRGFEKGEAEEYLREQGVPPDLIDAVVSASAPDIRLGIDVQPKGKKPKTSPGPSPVMPPAKPAPDRCNPYVIRLYMDWALSQPTPTADAIRTGGLGRYVELRLLQRLGHAGLERILPLVALLGHMDRSTLATIAGTGPAETDDLFTALVNQEWVGAHRSEGSPPREILDVAPDFRDLLQRYYAGMAPTPRQVELAMSAIETVTLDGKLSTIDGSDFDSGLRVMALRPERGQAWWSAVEARLFRKRPEWVERVVSNLLSTEGAAGAAVPGDHAGLPENPLRPFVLATRARLRATNRNGAGAIDDWVQVAALVRDRPEPAYRQLALRAVTGQIAAARWSGDLPPDDVVQSYWEAMGSGDVPIDDPSVAAALTAAVESLVDLAELQPDSADRLLGGYPPGRGGLKIQRSPQLLVTRIALGRSRWPDGGAKERAAIDALEGAVRLACGRSALLAGRGGGAREELEKALTLAPDGPTGSGWQDWEPPPNPRLRARLEVARIASPSLMSPGEALVLVGADHGTVDRATADGDRLVSMVIRLTLADGTRDLADLLDPWRDPSGEIAISPSEPPDLQPINAHRLVPPMFASVADGFIAEGRFGPARRLLQGVATGRAVPLDAQRSADRRLLQLARRLRSADGANPLDSSLAKSSDPEDAALTGALLGLSGPTSTGALAPDAPLGPHAAWRCSYVIDAPSAERLLERAVPTLEAASGSANDPLDSASLAVDLIEAAVISGVYGVGRQVGDLRPPPGPPSRPAVVRRGWDEDTLRIVLRETALAGRGFDARAHADLIERLGRRRAAELAFEEGELLGLRLPASASQILDAARALYEEVGDVFGQSAAATLSAMSLVRLTPHEPAERGEVGGGDAPVDFGRQTRVAREAWDAMRVAFADRAGAPTPADHGQIDAAAADPTDESLGRIDDPELGPWAIRLAACLLAMQDSSGDPTSPAATDAIRPWIERRYGAVGSSGVQLPTEWAHFFAQPLPVPVGTPAEPDEEVPTGGWDEKELGSFFGRALLFGAGGLLLILVGAFVLWRLVAGIVAPEFVAGTGLLGLILSFGLSVLGLALLAVAAYVIVRLGNRVVSAVSVTLAGRVDLTIEPVVGSGAAAASAPTRVGRTEVAITPTRWKAHLAFAIPPIRVKRSGAAAVEGMIVDDSETYARLASRIPRRLESLFAVPSIPGAGAMHVRVTAQGDLNALPWEGMITLAITPQKGSPKGARIRVSRLPDTSSLVAEVPRGHYTGRTVAATEAGVSLASDALQRYSADVDWYVADAFPGDASDRSASTAESQASDPSTRSPDIVHVIGLIVSDHGGPGIRLVPERSYGSQLSRQRRGTAESDAGRVIRPSDLRRAYPDARLFILQGHPPDEVIRRTASDRQAANLMRSCAAAMARHGVRVIVLPPLESALGSKCLARVQAAAPGFLDRGITSVLPAITQIQTDIFESQRGARASIWELALDVSVFDIPEQGIAADA